jgi:hypothetical protein
MKAPARKSFERQQEARHKNRGAQHKKTNDGRRPC